ncbi:MAG: PLP-dependent aspartate aminotransferase family protein [bacterium]
MGLENSDKKSPGLSTRAIHTGEEQPRPNREITTPVSLTSTYQFESMDEVREYITGKKPHFEYGRYGNPTREVASQKLASLESAGACLMTSSGMNAITTTLFAFLSEGDHIVATRDIYKKTFYFLEYNLKEYGVESTFVEPGDPEALKGAIQDNTKVLFSESPTNPFLNVIDLDMIADLGNEHGLKTIIDATFATPYNQRPLEMGIDLVIQSATKYLGGHNDLIAGAVLGSFPLVERVRELHHTLGGLIDPHSCYMLIRGLKTFESRMETINKNAQTVAEFLEDHSSVKEVFYPGLKSHPQHEVASQQMDGYGAVISFRINGELEEAESFLNELEYIKIAPSLGGVESLITHPATVSYYDFPEEERLEQGITNNLIRLSVGLENVDDLRNDLDRGLQTIV